ncbi:uncharacterized protein TNCV_4951511 [Trichonephila clavipes]|nr:uncharacterized protein TNCV_4951511 [Trichonephila clavipes]
MYEKFNSEKRSNAKILKSLEMHSRHVSTLNSRRAASPLVRLVERDERWEAPDHPQSVLHLNWGGSEPNRTVTCMVLKAKTNHRRKNLVLHSDELCGPRSDVTVYQWHK